MEHLSNEEAEWLFEQSRLSQMNSKRRRRHLERAAVEAAAGAAPGTAAGPALEGPPLQAGYLRQLSFCPPDCADLPPEPEGPLRWDRPDVDVATAQDVDTVFGDLWPAAGLPGPPQLVEGETRTVAEAQVVRVEAAAQAATATVDIALDPVSAPCRNVGVYMSGKPGQTRCQPACRSLKSSRL